MPAVSILIGRISLIDGLCFGECLDALTRLQCNLEYEIIVADRINDSYSNELKLLYPDITWIICNANHSLPTLRTMALRHSKGEYIFVTEDHCIPSENWLRAALDIFANSDNNISAVGGCVENGCDDTIIDWATFFCEYLAFVSPVTNGHTNSLPGMNIAYHRKVFNDLTDDYLASGFWEARLHPLLIDRGQQLFSTNDMMISHKKHFSIHQFACQRFMYSRHYAGQRFGSYKLPTRLLASAIGFALPPLLLSRMVKSIYHKHRLRRQFILAIPYLLFFICIWTIGEIWGTIFGPGKSLSRIE